MLAKSPCLAASACAWLVSGCFARGGRPLLVSSAASDYSPVVTFAAKLRVSDSVNVSIDRLRLLYPGEVLPGIGPVTGPIEMQADGSEMLSFGPMPAIRVFAYASRNVDGKQGKVREAIHKNYYSEGC